MLLSESYREQNRKLHEDPTYGVSSAQWARPLVELCNRVRSLDVLDYGCGKAELQKALDFPIQNYDPCIAEYASPPRPADVVACLDVLEHIEPEFVDAVLQDIYRLTNKAAMLLIANRPARKCLPDGRNAHLIQEGPEWWLPKIWATGFRVWEFKDVRNQNVQIAFSLIVDKEGWWQPTAKQ